jgi:hypothetical protein
MRLTRHVEWLPLPTVLQSVVIVSTTWVRYGDDDLRVASLDTVSPLAIRDVGHQ